MGPIARGCSDVVNFYSIREKPYSSNGNFRKLEKLVDQVVRDVRDVITSLI